MGERGQRVIVATTELIADLLREGTEPTTVLNPLPPDARMVEARIDVPRSEIRVLVDSAEWDMAGIGLDGALRYVPIFQRGRPVAGPGAPAAP